MVKFGSNAIPSRPRSPEESTERLRNGVASREPFLITRTWPVWRQTKSRPSGANSIAVGGPERLLPNSVSVNSGGKVAASENKAASVRKAPHPRIDWQRKFERRKGGIAGVDRFRTRITVIQQSPSIKRGRESMA